MPDVYVIFLHGQGDEDVKLVGKETFDFLTTEDAAVPQAQLDAWAREAPDRQRYNDRETIDDFTARLRQWQGSSPDNDRALRVRCEYAQHFYDMKSAMAYLREHQLALVDQYTGYLY